MLKMRFSTFYLYKEKAKNGRGRSHGLPMELGDDFL